MCILGTEMSVFARPFETFANLYRQQPIVWIVIIVTYDIQ